MTLSKEQREAIQKTLEKATPSPWEWQVRQLTKNGDDGYNLGDLQHWKNHDMPRYGTTILTITPNRYGIDVISAGNLADIELIANAPKWIRLLLASEQAWKEEADKQKERKYMRMAERDFYADKLNQAVEVIKQYADKRVYAFSWYRKAEEYTQPARDFLSSLSQESEGKV